MSIESVMPASHLILYRPLLLLPPIPPGIRVFPNESTLRIRWPKYWSFSFSIIPSKEIPGLISLRMDWLDLLAVQGEDSQESSLTPQFKSINSSVLSLGGNSQLLWLQRLLPFLFLFSFSFWYSHYTCYTFCGYPTVLAYSICQCSKHLDVSDLHNNSIK